MVCTCTCIHTVDCSSYHANVNVTIEISNDWEDINTDPALKDLVAEDQLVQNIRSEKSSFPKSLDSGLAFKPLLQRHSKTSVQSLAEPFHRRFIRSGLHSRRFSANDELQKVRYVLPFSTVRA